jgi:PmbA protein
VASELDAYRLINRLKLKGFQAELFHASVKEFSLEYDTTLRSEISQDEGYGLRVAKDKKMGFAFSTRLTEELIDRALQSWSVSKEDEANVIPPGKPGAGLVLHKFDFDSAIEEAKDAFVSSLDFPEWVKLGHAGLSIGTGTVEVVSTEGSDKASKFTFSTSYFSGNARIGDRTSASVSSSRASKDLSSVKSQAVKEEFLYKLEIARKEVEPTKLPDVVTLTPEALQDLLLPLLRYAVSTDTIYRGASPLKLGEDFGSKLTIVDDPTIDNMIMSREFDGEGLPSKRNEIISNGKFVRSINTYYWALKANVEPSHSAWRSYSGSPAASFSNVVIKAKEPGEEEGIVIDSVRGVHTSDFASGAFSVSVGLAWYPKEEKAVKGLNLSGTLKDVLRGVVAEAGDEVVVWNLKSRSLVIRGLKLT